MPSNSLAPVELATWNQLRSPVMLIRRVTPVGCTSATSEDGCTDGGVVVTGGVVVATAGALLGVATAEGLGATVTVGVGVVPADVVAGPLPALVTRL